MKVLRAIRYGRLGIAVVLGVVTSVGVAWGVYRWKKPSTAAWVEAVWMESASRGVMIANRREVGRRTLGLMRVDLPAGGEEPRLPYGSRWSVIEYSQARDMAPEIVDVGPGVTAIFVESAGFPMLCVEGRVEHVAFMPNGQYGQLRLGSSDLVGVPAWPLWGGLAVNTACYGAAWYPLLGVPGILFARWRRRKGMCGACGYDMRGLAVATCPECGKASGLVEKQA